MFFEFSFTPVIVTTVPKYIEATSFFSRTLVARSFTVSATACAVTETICSAISPSADAGEKNVVSSISSSSYLSCFLLFLAFIKLGNRLP